MEVSMNDLTKKHFVTNSMGTKQRVNQAWLVIAILTALVFAACGKSIPVQKLEAAHEQVTAASAEGAAEYANETYTQAREALLAAHQNLADDKLSDAENNAAKAQGLAIEARRASAPRNTQKKSEESAAAITQADDAYAEVLAPRDFAAAKELQEDAARRQSTAKTLASDPSKALESLRNYSEAARKYDASKEAAVKARSLALSQKSDILDSLAGIRSNLEKAETYGAAEENPNALAAARADLTKAEELIKADKLKEGHAIMKKAEDASNQLLASVEAKYADKKLAEAKKAVGRSQKHFSAINTSANKKTAGKKALLTALSEQVGAANEALKSSENYYADKKFSDSINESEEAIRLSQIIFEKANLFAKARNTKLDVGGSDAEEMTGMENGNAKVYTVQKTRPADSLWRIAKKKKHYGNGHYWTRIYKANKSKIKNPNLIYPGQKFVIPLTKKSTSSKAADATKTTEETLEEKLKREAAKKVEEKIEEKTEEMEQPRENEGQ